MTGPLANGLRGAQTGHAVVLGGSIAGLLAARVLADFFEQVTIVERDDIKLDGEPTVASQTVAAPTGPAPAGPAPAGPARTHATPAPAAIGVPSVPEHRRGVPQDRHLHALTERGRQIIDELFPSFTAELCGQGVPTVEMLVGFRWYLGGLPVQSVPAGLTMLLASRPLLETAIRARTLAVPNIRLRSHLRAAGLVAASASRGGPGRVGGVRVVPLVPRGLEPPAARLRPSPEAARSLFPAPPEAGQRHGRAAFGPLGHRAERENAEIIDADLVIDATGRGSRAPEWLAALGMARPLEERLDIDLGYASRSYRRQPGDLAGDRGVVVHSLPGRLHRGGMASAQEDNRWIVTLTGMLGDHPPTDPAGFEEFAASLAVPDVHRLITHAEPLDNAVPYRFRGSLRRRYDRLKSPCEGFVAVGDAACCLNPLYAQGMTVAAQQALALQDCLRSGGTEALARRFFARTAKPVGHAWTLASDSDLRYPGVSARRPFRTRLVNAYISRVQAAMHTDPDITRLFLRVANLVEPPSALIRPPALTRVARHSR